jgi:hypothetical protein
MILISHRGNINGRIIERENSPLYVDEALNLGYNVEIDVWIDKGLVFLGHDNPQYQIDSYWLNKRHSKLWIHCKNIESLEWMSDKLNYNYFWHEHDTLTITSHRYIWVYPGKQVVKNSIGVLPEIHNDDISQCIGVCSDYIVKHLKKVVN